MLNIEKIKNDFPILKDKSLIYLDNSSTSLTPRSVINAMTEYYEAYNSNVHRGIYSISQKATEEYEKAHKKVANFIGADFEEIIFTKGATESLNLLAYTLTKSLNPGDEILLTEMEHHSNLVPWQQLAKEKNLVLKFIPVNKQGRLDLSSLNELINEKTKIVSLTHMSNVLGTINDVKAIAKIAHAKSALLVVDAAQSIPHFEVNVKELDCDFLAFSGHKMLGPTGIGVLYGKKELLENLDPFQFGGNMISEVSLTDSSWNDLPWKFEAGTPNIAEGIGLGKAIDFLLDIGMKNIKEHVDQLVQYTLESLGKVKNLEIYGPINTENRGGVISFNLNGIHPHDVASVLNNTGIAIRGGHLCAMPLIKNNLNVASVCRISLYFYNTQEDIDLLVSKLEKVKEVFL
jgi:cysteine desulfurase / selenocysteine lyase